MISKNLFVDILSLYTYDETLGEARIAKNSSDVNGEMEMMKDKGKSKYP